MKLTRLTLAGFGPYKAQQTVDFTRFDDDGIFLITGKTGAGKSSILDAVCFALYGSVPRYDGAQPRLRSDHAGLHDPTFVELEFTVAGVDYRVRRTPEYERPKRGGTGTTKQAHEASLSRLVGSEWHGVAAKPVDVGRELAGILLLTKEQFLQVILLAQNRFHEFLLAKNDDRQGVLRSLFGTERFLRFEERLTQREKAMSGDLAAGGAELARRAVAVAEIGGVSLPELADEGWFAAALTAANLAENDLSAAATEATAQFKAADANFTVLLELSTVQLRRETAQGQLDALALGAVAIDSDRTALNEARRADRVWPLSLAWDSAVEEQNASLRAEEAAVEVFDVESSVLPDFDSGTPSALTDLNATVAGLADTRGALADAIVNEARLPALTRTLSELDGRRAATDTAIHDLGVRAAELPARLSEIDDRIAETKLRAAALESLEESRERLGAMLAAATLSVTLANDVSTAMEAEAAAITLHAQTANALNASVQGRLNGHAAELSSELAAGEPCSVCGSTEHPRPTQSGTERVTAHDVEQARQAVDTSWQLVETRNAALTVVRVAQAESAAVAGGRSSEELSEQLKTLSADYENANTAATGLPVLVASRQKLESEVVAAASTLQTLQDARVAEISEQSSVRAVVEAICDQVTKTLCGFETVGARAAHLDRVLSAAKALVAAQQRSQVCRDNAAVALEFLETQRQESAFADVAAALAARLSEAETLRIEQRVREHDQGVASAQSVLNETADATAAPVDVEAARAARADLSARRDEALGNHVSALARAKQIRVEVEAALILLTTLGTKGSEYEQLRQLAGVVQGGEANSLRMRLESFVLAAQLEEIVTAANRRLKIMTGGRFTLEHDDAVQYRKARSGLNLAIRDEHTGRSRVPHSLSGGETFLASLALALGLAEVVTNQTGGIRLDTLFVDEGFGSLDSDTLEIAMTTLEGLRAGGRTIGLISHVDAMKEQIAAKLEIAVTAHGDSVILPAPGTKNG